MDTRPAVGGAHHSESVATSHPLTCGDIDPRQKGRRDLESRDRFDGQGHHPCHGTGEADPSSSGCSHHLAHGSAEVDAPMTGISTGQGIPGDYRTADRRSQADRGKSEGDEHLSPINSNL